MSDVLENAVCGVDGCAPAALDYFGQASGAKATLAIEVISDAICPWCWVAKRRLDRAIAALAPDITASVAWLPFELNPEMPKAGVDRRAYRSAKFGSWQRSQALDAQVAAAGRSDGFVFNHDRMERTPNTVDAHRLIWLAGQHGKQVAVVEGLFAAYFNEGRDVGDATVLAEIGASVGLDRGGPSHARVGRRTSRGAVGTAARREPWCVGRSNPCSSMVSPSSRARYARS